MAVNPIPAGHGTVTPSIIVKEAAKAIDWYKKALGAEEVSRFEGPDGRIMHAEIKIGDSHIMLADEAPEMDARSPKHYGGSPISLMLYVEDVDKLFAQAVAAGATATQPVTDKFYGDRSGTVKDPFGHSWHLSTHKEDVSPDEMKKRMDAMHKG